MTLLERAPVALRAINLNLFSGSEQIAAIRASRLSEAATLRQVRRARVARGQILRRLSKLISEAIDLADRARSRDRLQHPAALAASGDGSVRANGAAQA